MTFMDQGAEAPSLRAALLIILGALDIINEKLDHPMTTIEPSGWDEPAWIKEEATGYDPGYDLTERSPLYEKLHAVNPAAPKRVGNEYIIPPPSPELLEQRELFVVNYLGSDITMAGHYAAGGPEWLMAYDSEFVATLPAGAKQSMTQDFEARGLSQEAREFAVAFLRGEASSMADAAPLADTLQ